MTASVPPGSWTSHDVILNGEWDARRESVEEIVARLEPTLRALDAVVGPGVAWRDVEADRAMPDVSSDALERFVAVAVSTGDLGDTHPGTGYEFSLGGQAGGPGLTAQFRVGSGFAGRRKLSNSVSVRLGSATPGQVDTVLLSIVEFWNPTAAVAWDTDTAMLSGGRGRFAPAVGQRTWLSDRLGPVTRSADGIRSETVSGGTLLSADDEWTPEQVNAAMVITLADNGISTLRPDPSRT